MRNLVAGELERLLPDQLGDLHLLRQVGALLGGEVRRPLGQQRHELVAQLAHAVAGLGADRMQRVELTEPRAHGHLRCDVTRLEPVDLVERDHDGDAELEDPRGDEAVTRPDTVAGVEHEQHAVHVLEGRVHRALHVLGERIPRPLEPGQVGEHELPVGAVDDAEDPPPRRLRLVRDDGDLAAAERVDQRGLADVGTAGDRDEAAPHSSNVSGSSSAGVTVTTSPPARR